MSKNFLTSHFNEICYSNKKKINFLNLNKKLKKLNEYDIYNYLEFIKKNHKNEIIKNKNIYYSSHTKDLKKSIIKIINSLDKKFYKKRNNRKLILFFLIDVLNKNEIKSLININQFHYTMKIQLTFRKFLSKAIDFISFLILKIFLKNKKICVLNNYPRISYLLWYLQTTVYLDKKQNIENKYILFSRNIDFNKFPFQLYENYFKLKIISSNKLLRIFNIFFSLLNKHESRFIHKFQHISSNIHDYNCSKILIEPNNNIETKIILFLKKYKINRYKYVVMNFRNKEYYNNISIKFGIKKERFERTFHRNPNLNNYKGFKEYLLKRKIKLIKVNSPNEIVFNGRKINIDDDISILLHKYCLFSIACNTGSWHIPLIFNRPFIVLDDTNYDLWLHNSNNKIKNMATFVKIFDLKKNKYLSIREAQLRRKEYLTYDLAKKNNLKTIFNGNDSNLKYLDEMYQRATNSWRNKKEEKTLERIFKKNILRSSRLFNFKGIVSYYWLRENKKLFN